MDALRAAMSFQGRINRARYWLISVLGGLAMVVGVFAAFTPLVGPVITAVVVVGALVASTSASVRRMHDRGRSGWWLLLAYVPLFLLGGLSAAMRTGGAETAAILPNLLSFLISLWLLVDLGCLRGQEGGNRFGPDPLNPTQADVFN